MIYMKRAEWETSEEHRIARGITFPLRKNWRKFHNILLFTQENEESILSFSNDTHLRGGIPGSKNLHKVSKNDQ